MTSSESFYGEKMQELQKQLNSVKQAINTNSKVVAFMNSPVGQYLDEHPFVSLSLLVFISLSAVPLGLFLTVIVGTAVIACLGVIILEGIVIAVGGVTLLCVLCGLVILSFGVSGVLSISYFAISSILNYIHKARLSKNDSRQSQPYSKTAEQQPSVNAFKDTTRDE
ncbi:PREDICTED: promethin [Nanorana parkeri]|uniref:promethin n=1 Tax=Nanorana parkeri TaxID=125878 RepID=UPI0008544166|nr:PREDICTED: promethin [Nanorana parkeri]